MNAIVIALLIAMGSSLGGAYYGYQRGKERVQLKWDKQKVKDAEETKKQRDEGFVIAAELENDLTELRTRYARVNAQRTAALNEQIECPASGRIGDLVVPAATVRSMFNLPEPGIVVHPPGQAASQPPGAVR